MKRKTSLKDIADKVGVSTALVSYVLNNQKLERISKEVAHKIKEAAIELNYVTNYIAKSLKTNKTFTIGLIVADISNPFSSTLARIIEDEAELSNYTVIFCSSDEKPEKLNKLINILLNRQVDGFIIAATENSGGLIAQLKTKEVPFVLIDRYFPDMEVSYVAIDNYQASYSAVEHMIREGNRRIAMITYDSTLYHLEERERGYREALLHHQLPFADHLVKRLELKDESKEINGAIDALLSLPEPVEAILFASNKLSTFALRYLNTLDIKVPRDVALASFDESDACYLFYAPLTHIRQPLEEMAKAATKILIDCIDGDETIRRLNLEAPLVIGKSTKRVPNPAG